MSGSVGAVCLAQLPLRTVGEGSTPYAPFNAVEKSF
jgi:hypothetical protein